MSARRTSLRSRSQTQRDIEYLSAVVPLRGRRWVVVTAYKNIPVSDFGFRLCPNRKAAEYIRSTRPELADKLPEPNTTDAPIEKLAKIDTRVAKEVLGMDSFIDWKTTLSDCIDDLLAKQKNGWN